MQKYFVYILYSQAADNFYIGQTQDLVNRVESHNRGYDRSTKSSLPWVLFAFTQVESRSMAISIERKLKNLKSKSRILKYVSNNKDWNQLDNIIESTAQLVSILVIFNCLKNGGSQKNIITQSFFVFRD